MLDGWYFEHSISSWPELLEVFDRHRTAPDGSSGDQWIFRGQSNVSWRLRTTLERALERHGLGQDQVLNSSDSTPQCLESGLLRKFMRECHRFGIAAPDDDDHLEWFAWMRHYGAPTRLLDFTYSPFVATLMAVAGTDGESAVWAYNSDATREGLECILEEAAPAFVHQQYEKDRDLSDRSTFKALFMAQPPLTLVGSVNPFRLNERLVVQQGIFLCPGNISVSFVDNLRAVVEKCTGKPDQICIKYRIAQSRALRREILRNLIRMNVSEASLFPGLDGFARSLWDWLAFPEVVCPREDSC